jgi:hypothetical protein
MQTKLSDKTFEFYVILFKKCSLSGRQALLCSMMDKYPEYYQEFIDAIDNKLYINSIGRA